MNDFLKTPVLEALEKAGRPQKPKELARALDIPAGDYRAFKDFLRRLADSGDLYRVKQGRYAPPERINLVTGTLSVIRSGAAFLASDKGGEDVFVPADQLHNAYHRDRVVVRVEHRRRGLEGSVVRILERARTSFVGSVRRTKHFVLVKPDDPKFRKELFVPLDEAGEARDGEKVMVEVLDWGSTTSGPVGRITEVLGMPGDPGLDVLMIIKNNGLPGDFPEEVTAAAEAIPDEVSEEEIATRVDLRDEMVVTIDPPTAKDFDDALSLRELPDGNLELGVHIADVSHYVRHDDPLDREAYLRGTSVYLVDRVIPMLPEKISNHLCSLNPDVDRLAMSVIAVLSPKGKVVDYRIEDTVIRSKMRLAYEEVQGYFDGDPAATRKVEPVRDVLDRLRRMADVLNGKREARGSLDFDLPSSRVLLDEEGLPVDIQKVVRLESNRLVEEFMLLANEIVARHLREAKVPAVFRVHEEPQEKKLDELAEQIGPFGYNLYGGNERGSITPRELQRILQQAEGRPEEYIVHMLVLRSLMQARYDVYPLGHFGLALQDYTHFTSPIRRYPDLLVHRILRVMSGKQRKPIPDEARYREWLVDAAVRSSERERLAESAERDSVELKKIQFMERHLGEVFEGVVSGVQVFGFFVELLRYHVSGLVHVNNLQDDYYEFWEDEFSLVGSNTGRRFRIGDRVMVQVLSVNKELRQIDFLIEDVLAEAEPEAVRRRKARAEFEGKDKRKKPPSRIEEREQRRKKSRGGGGKTRAGDGTSRGGGGKTRGKAKRGGKRK